jgi:hypothetical protein
MTRKAGFTFNDIKTLVDEPSLKATIKSRDHDGNIRDMMKYYNNAVVIYLFETPIVTYDTELDRLIINSGGYHTVTTSASINKVIGIFGYAVYQKHYKWYISDFNKKESYEYYDGFIIERVLTKYQSIME